MNNLPDPLDEAMPSWPLPMLPKAAVEYEDDGVDAPAPTPRKITADLVWRAFRRHWWQIFLLWGVVSSGLMTLAYLRVKPTYYAVAQVRVEPGEQSLYTIKTGSTTEFAEFKETQRETVTSPVVLGLALAEHPELYQLPKLQRAEDAEAEIAQLLKVQIVPKTSLIQIAMASETPTEAVGVVNAVLDAYLKNASSTSNAETERRIEQLKKAVEERKADLEDHRREWRRLSDRIGAADIEGVKDSKSITTEDYRQWSDQLATVEIDRVAADAMLDQIRNEKVVAGRAQDQKIEEAVKDAFYAHPNVMPILAKIDQARMAIERSKRTSRNQRDPSRLHHEQTVKSLGAQLQKLQKSLWPRLRREVMAGPDAADSEREAERRLVVLKTREVHLRDKLRGMKLKSQEAGAEALALEFSRHDTERALNVLHKVEDTLNQLEHEARSPVARVHEDFRARPSKRPNSNHRYKAMALAPIAAFFLAMGTFVVLERRAGRVANPEELMGRARVQVLGVVPPLPTGRTSGLLARRDDFRARRQLDEFVQSLDHLRVALCARTDPWGRDRHCVLITSACSSEGKTTLAAQLAERCVNAGLMTLLIDADLRNPTLSRMLDASGNEGLVDVLRGDTTPEAAMLIVDDAGGFHFLPAGSAGCDPSRVLQGDALGKLLARARETFDMIIVDAPPVLPVPDALTIGRWTDGAVLAVRYDTSRFSFVERAQRRLAHVGVPVIGAVVNGLRSSGSAYGGHYAYGGPVASASTDVDG